jgi:hypothetical protein
MHRLVFGLWGYDLFWGRRRKPPMHGQKIYRGALKGYHEFTVEGMEK